MTNIGEVKAGLTAVNHQVNTESGVYDRVRAYEHDRVLAAISPVRAILDAQQQLETIFSDTKDRAILLQAMARTTREGMGTVQASTEGTADPNGRITRALGSMEIAANEADTFGAYAATAENEFMKALGLLGRFVTAMTASNAACANAMEAAYNSEDETVTAYTQLELYVMEH